MRQSNEERSRDESRKPRVFISYSRTDSGFANRILGRLTEHGIDAYLDKHDILPGEPWKERLSQLIDTSDSVVFCVSPASVASPVCDWEVNEAERIGKRLLPVVCVDADSDKVPGRLKRLNYIFLREQDDFATEFYKLVTAITADFSWVREHTRIGELARRWIGNGRPDGQLLRDADIDAAESWQIKRPPGAAELTPEYLDFIQASRVSATQRARREHRRNRIITLGSVSAAVITSLLAWIMYGQWREGLRAQSLYVADLANGEITPPLSAARRAIAVSLALEALPDNTSISLTQRLRPYEPRARFALEQAWRASGGIVARYKGHSDGVLSAAFSPDGRQVLTASADRTARLWDLPSAKEVIRFEGHTDNVTSAEFSADGKAILTTSLDHSARVWDAHSGRPIATFEAHVTSATFAPDGGTVLTASDDAARVWGVASGKELARFAEPQGAVLSAVFSPDAKAVLTASSNNTLRLWNVASGGETTHIETRQDRISRAILSPDGRSALAVFWNKACLFDLASGKQEACFVGHSAGITSAAFSPNGATVFTGSADNTARIWDVLTERELWRLEGHQHAVVKGVFSPDGKFVLTVSLDESVRLWDLSSGQELLRLENSPFTSAVFSSDGKRVLTASDSLLSQDDNVAELWNIASGQEMARLQVHELHLDECDPVIRSKEQGSPPGTNPCLGGPEEGLTSAVLSADDKSVLTASLAGFAQLWEIATGREVRRFAGHDAEMLSASFSPNGEAIVTASSDGTAVIWDVSSGAERMQLKGHSAPVVAAAFSPDGNSVVTASQDKTARVWDVASGKETARFAGHDDYLTSAVFSPDGRLVLTASNDRTARLWDMRSQTQLTTFKGDERVTSATFSPDSKVVLTAAGKIAQLWDAFSGDEIGRLVGHQGSVESAQFSHDGHTVITASWDKTARLWDVASRTEIGRLEGHQLGVYSAAFSSDGRAALTASHDNSARLWPVFPGAQSLVDHIKKTPLRCLSEEERARFHLPSGGTRQCNVTRKATQAGDASN
jgi:WD40 repeat protein